VDIATDLFAISATIGRAQMQIKKTPDEASSAIHVADLFCQQARIRIKKNFQGLSLNSDTAQRSVSRHILKGDLTWLEQEKVLAVKEKAV
jgi:hypothetical protein